ncbi:hypothetical protein [Agreia sp. Leaf283]|uniref:hypothetical protein n=1 Tax=Agreia sp. Leaf283 TaxID=1736321 RepID=UPI0012FA02CD|nr:hypothetical protein [Agreia sp. Leaf283]
MSQFNEVTFDTLLLGLSAGRSGPSIESMMKDYEESATDGSYTVYWPKNSIRVIEGADYGTARTIACILRDERTLWMGESTTFAEPVIARVRASLGSKPHATFEEVRTGTVYTKDKLLPGDIRVKVPSAFIGQAEFPGAPYRFDYATLPEN